MCVCIEYYTKAAGTVCTLRGVEGFSYFCSGKSVAPVSEAAKGKPRTVDRVSASFFVYLAANATICGVHKQDGAV